jgi:predicted transcriptional regulator
MARPGDLPSPTEAQLEILEVVWARGQATVGEVWKALAARRPVARNTVQTTIARLEERGWLRARRDGSTTRYAAAAGRDGVRASLARRMADVVFGGSTADMVMALLQGRRVSSEEAEKIRRLIERAEGGRR